MRFQDLFGFDDRWNTKIATRIDCGRATIFSYHQHQTSVCFSNFLPILIIDLLSTWVTGREKNAKPIKGSRTYIMAKKERMEKQGKWVYFNLRFLVYQKLCREVRPNTKYTGRKRRHGV